MGTGVGEIALADAAILGGEYAGGLGLTGALTGGVADAALLGGEFAGGLGALGATGALAGGISNAALLGGEYAGGLGSLSPAFQQAVTGTASVMPDVAAQTAQFANVGAVPPAGAELGWNPADLATAGQGAGDIAAGQASTPGALAQQFGSGIQNLNPNAPLYEMDAAETADITKHINPEFMHSYLPTDTPNAVDMANKAQLAEAAAKYPDLYPGGITPDGSTIFNPAGNAQYSFHPAEKVVSALEARGAAVAPGATPFSSAAEKAYAAYPDMGAGAPTGSLGANLPDVASTAAKTPGIMDLLKTATQPFQDWWEDQNTLTKYGLGGLGAMQAAKYLNRPQGVAAPEKYSGPLSKFSYDPSTYTPYTYKPYAAGGPVEEMSRENALGANTGYPQADINQGAYATPWQTPVSRNVVTGPSDANVDQMTGEERMAGGGIASLGGYSDGGRLLRGPGDGMSDNIPANIGGRQPARLADGEFVVPADVVSGLGNGSTDAGAKQLYKMLDKVRSARTGTKKQGRKINPNKYTPA